MRIERYPLRGLAVQDIARTSIDDLHVQVDTRPDEVHDELERDARLEMTKTPRSRYRMTVGMEYGTRLENGRDLRRVRRLG